MAEIPNQIVLPSVTPRIDAPDTMQQIEPKAGAGLQQIGDAALKQGQFLGQLQTSDVTASALQQAQTVLDNYSKLSGKAAVDGEDDANKQIQDIFNDAEGQLHSPDQVAQFQQIAREYQTRYFGGRVSEYADQGKRQWISQSNAAARNVALNGISSDPNSDANFSVYLNQMRSANIKDLQAAGNASDPTITASVLQQSDAAAWKTRIAAVAPTNPQLALQWTQQNQKSLGTDYAPMAEELQNRADKANADATVDGLFAGRSAPPAYTGGGRAPVNNPFNLRVPGSKTDFQVFPTQQDGINAGLQQIVRDNTPTAQGGHGLSTLSQIINSYAPSTENNTSAYIQTVAHAAGIDPDAPIDLRNNPDLLQKVGQAMASVEGNFGGSTKAQIYQQIEASGRTDAWKSYAYAHVDQVLSEQQIAQQNQTAMTHAQSEQYASTFATQIWTAQDAGKPISPDIVKQIDAAPIDYATKDALRRIALSATGQAQTIGYGPGYTAAFNSILAPYGTPGKITDASQVLQLQANRQLTSSGAKDLIGTLHDASSTTGAGMATAKAGLLNYARSRLSFEDDTGPVQIKDPQGQAIYDTKFIPMFEASYAGWIKAGKDPMTYPVDQIDKMVTTLRPPAAMAAAQIAALGDTDIPGTQTPNATPAAPPPPPPATVKNTTQWGTYMAQPPQTQNGPISAGQWGEAIGMLMANPKQNIPLFDKVFQPYGYDGAEIVQRLSNAPEAPEQFTVRAKGVTAHAPAASKY
jgi:hypothetical protein